MAKSIKDKNWYWDSKGISHNRKKLSEYLTEIDNMKTANINTWFHVTYVPGSGIRFVIPIFNPSAAMPTLNLSIVQIYKNDKFNDISASDISVWSWGRNYITLYINIDNYNLGLTFGETYIVKVMGYIKCS